MAFNAKPLEVYGIQQSILFPTLYFAGKRINKAKLKMEQSRYELQKQNLERDVASAYYQLLFAREKKAVYKYLDSIYQKFANASQRRFELGETNYLEKITAQAKQKELLALFNQAREDVGIAYAKLQKITQVAAPLNIAITPLPKLQLSQTDVALNVAILLYDQRNLLFEAKSGFEKQQLLPDLSVDYFQGTNSGLGENL